MLIQIYEIQNEIEARLISQAGVDHIGILVGPGEFPREFSLERAAQILDAVPKNSKRVALTLSNELTKIERIAHHLQPDILHLGTIPQGIQPEDVKHLKKKFPDIRIMRSIPVIDTGSLDLAKQYDEIADFLLLDTHKLGDAQIGATGLIHDWSISRQIVDSVHIPVILAGGLGPDNVEDAIRAVRPAGVDSKTKTDQVGSHEKDIPKIIKFVDAIRGTEPL